MARNPREQNQLRKQIMKEDSPSVYVLNRNIINHNGEKKKSIMVITVNQNNRDIIVPIPVTYVPWDVCEKVSKEAIFSSPDFLSAVNSGKLELVDTEAAWKALDKQENQMEYESARKSVSGDNVDALALTALDDDVKSKGGIEHTMSDEEKLASNTAPKVIDLCDREDLNSNIVKSFILNERDTMTPTDFTYMEKNLPNSILKNAQIEHMLVNGKNNDEAE